MLRWTLFTNYNLNICCLKRPNADDGATLRTVAGAAKKKIHFFNDKGVAYGSGLLFLLVFCFFLPPVFKTGKRQQNPKPQITAISLEKKTSKNNEQKKTNTKKKNCLKTIAQISPHESKLNLVLYRDAITTTTGSSYSCYCYCCCCHCCWWLAINSNRCW